MLQESKTNELEYQRLSKEEMEQRGILGRLVGICADFMSPTRNGRKYPEKLWENVFNDPIMKERIDNGVCYGELGHPADREETDMEKIAVCMAEQPRKGKDGKLRAVFDILNTPNGRILKSLCDYGSTLGISSRGSGDLETDFDGQESVNPDTYNCEGFDVVLIPAVKEARLQYVNEALDKKRYNKTLRDRLTESIHNESEENQEKVLQSLRDFGIELDYSDKDNWEKAGFNVATPEETAKAVGVPIKESQYKDNEVQNTESGTIVRDSVGNFVQEFPTDDEAREWIDDQELDESMDLDESALTPEEKMDLWHAGERKENIKACGDAKLYRYREICKDKNYIREVQAIDAELQNRGLHVPEQSSQVYPKAENKKPTCNMQNGVLFILFDNVGKKFLSNYTRIDNVPRDLIKGKEYFVIKKSDPFANKLATDLVKILNESYVKQSICEAFDITLIENINDNADDNSPEINTADDDGVMVEELQKSLDLNRKLDKKIVDLQEKLSVSYAKEMNLQEELEKYKSKVIKLSRRLAEEKVNNDKLMAVQDKKVIAEETCKQLTESVKTKTAKITSLKESVDKKKGQIVSLNEQIQQLMSALDERNNQFETLTEKYETLNKDYQQVKENYSKKIEQQNALVEKYRGVAVKSVNKYIDTQATRLGISSAEIKNRLPESYSFTDIDRVCEDLQEYKLNISNLPFSTGNRLNEGMRIKGTNMNQKTLVPVEDDIDELTLRLAGL